MWVEAGGDTVKGSGFEEEEEGDTKNWERNDSRTKTATQSEASR